MFTTRDGRMAIRDGSLTGGMVITLITTHGQPYIPIIPAQLFLTCMTWKMPKQTGSIK